MDNAPIQSPQQRCDENGKCWVMQDHIKDKGPGFVDIITFRRWRGVSYYVTGKRSDSGILVNFCPWCGGRPGQLAARLDSATAGRE